MEPITTAGDECSNAGGIQEKIRQPIDKSALAWISGLSRVASWDPSNSSYSMMSLKTQMALFTSCNEHGESLEKIFVRGGELQLIFFCNC